MLRLIKQFTHLVPEAMLDMVIGDARVLVDNETQEEVIQFQNGSGYRMPLAELPEELRTLLLSTEETIAAYLDKTFVPKEELINTDLEASIKKSKENKEKDLT